MLSPGLNMLSHFMVGDPIQCAFTLQVVAETAFTNIVFVATPDVAARNGDFTLPTTYLSVQSDEARHISNGYATLLTVLQDDHNAPLIERDLQQAFWINHAFIDVFSAVVIEYFSRDRSDPESFLDKWDRWVRDDWHRAYVMMLGKLGLDIPRNVSDPCDGWDASEVIEHVGFVRADGEAAMGQPHLDAERRWTLSDIRAHNLKLTSPNIRMAAELGLPSGDWSGVPSGNGAVPM